MLQYFHVHVTTEMKCSSKVLEHIVQGVYVKFYSIVTLLYDRNQV